MGNTPSTPSGWFNQPNLGATGQTSWNSEFAGHVQVDARLTKSYWVGDPLLGATLQTALTYLGAVTPAILHVGPGAYSITGNTTVTSNITLIIYAGATVTIATTKTLTINGSLQAGPYQIFSCTGTGKVVIGGPNRIVQAEWFGALTTASNNSVAVAKAIEAFTAPGILQFGAGIFTFTSSAVAAIEIQPGIVFRGMGQCSNPTTLAALGTNTGTVLKYTGTSTLFKFRNLSYPAAMAGWGFEDLNVVCTSTGSAIEIGDTSQTWPAHGAILNWSLRRVSLLGNGGDFGVGGFTAYYGITDRHCRIEGFKDGIFLKACDLCYLEGTANNLEKNVHIIASGGAGSYNTVKITHNDIASGGYLCYDTANNTTYEPSQYEGLTSGSKGFYLNGEGTILNGVLIATTDAGTIGPDAKDIRFINPQANVTNPFVIDLPTTYTVASTVTNYIHIISPNEGFLLTALPTENPRVIIHSDHRTMNDTATGTDSEGGADRAIAAINNLSAFAGSPGIQNNQMVMTALTKGYLTYFKDIRWVADALATVGSGWAIWVPDFSGTGAPRLQRAMKVGKQVNSGDTLIVTVKYRASATPGGGAAAFSIDGSVTGSIVAYDPVTTPTTSYQTVTKTYVLPALTTGEILTISFGNFLTTQPKELYVDFLSIVPNAKVIRSRAFATEKQSVAYASTVTPDWSKGSFLSIAQLTGAIELLNPTVNAATGQRVCVMMVADGTNRAVTYDTKYVAAFAQVNANKTYILELIFDGTNYVQVGALI